MIGDRRRWQPKDDLQLAVHAHTSLLSRLKVQIRRAGAHYRSQERVGLGVASVRSCMFDLVGFVGCVVVVVHDGSMLETW